MAVARAAATDIKLLNFTLGADSFPTNVLMGNVLDNLYKDGYRCVYGAGYYKVYDAGDEDPIIDTEEFKVIIIQEAEDIANAWHYSGKDIPPPSSRLSKETKKEIKELLRKSPNRITNVRVYGEVWDDY